MIVRLRILHGTLQDNQGQSQLAEVAIRGPRFVVGSASDCAMCCRSSTVDPYHCEIRIAEQCVVVRTLSPEKGTFVNDVPVEGERALCNGDHLRIGRLEFEVVIGEPTPVASAARNSDRASAASDVIAEAIRELLDEADESSRSSPRERPQWHPPHLDRAATGAAKTPSRPAEAPGKSVAGNGKSAAGNGATKGKQGAGRLPSPPPTAESPWRDSAEAAQQALAKLLSR